jgi:hypothetical protein
VFRGIKGLGGAVTRIHWYSGDRSSCMSKIPIVDSGTMEQVLFSMVFREFARRVVMFL